MTKEVSLSIRAMHTDAGVKSQDVKETIDGINMESTNMETYVDAEYYMKNGSHYVLYEESMEGFGKTSQNRIKLKDHRLEMTRRGLLNTTMIFEENSTHMTDYVTPYGKMLLGIHTKKIWVEEHSDFMHILVEYVLEADEEPLSHCKMELEIRQKQ